MSSQAGLTKAGTILLLVGAILSAVGAVFVVLAAVGLGVAVAATGEMAVAFIIWLYGILALLLAVGTVFGFMAWNKARDGDMAGAFVFGLVSSLLPPLQVVTLLGAIFCKVSEDA